MGNAWSVEFGRWWLSGKRLQTRRQAGAFTRPPKLLFPPTSRYWSSDLHEGIERVIDCLLAKQYHAQRPSCCLSVKVVSSTEAAHVALDRMQNLAPADFCVSSPCGRGVKTCRKAVSQNSTWSSALSVTNDVLAFTRRKRQQTLRTGQKTEISSSPSVWITSAFSSCTIW